MHRSILILILLFNSGNPSVTEPTCSKFHYEEQTLEKMIRQEIKVEQMKADIELTEERVFEALEELKTEKIEFKRDVREAMDKELKRMNTEINRTIDQYIKENEKTKASLKPLVIAFKADTVAEKSMNTDKTFVFSNVIFNIGAAYNDKAGIFTAPVTGLYLFTAQLCLHQEDWAHFGIVVNGKTVSETGIGDTKWWKCYTMDAITVVEKGIDVYIKCTQSCDEGDKLKTHDHATSSFSGALIHKTA